jgi:hypothetical protein
MFPCDVLWTCFIVDLSPPGFSGASRWAVASSWRLAAPGFRILPAVTVALEGAPGLAGGDAFIAGSY